MFLYFPTYKRVKVANEYIQIKKKAFSLLARREHGVEELRTKLSLKAYNVVLIDDVITEFVTEDYLSDARYVEMMFRYHFGRGQGPRKILNLIRLAQVSDATAQQAFHAFDGDWHESASHVRYKRFGDWSGDFNDKPRQIRFLTSRGFEHGQIEHAFSHKVDS